MNNITQNQFEEHLKKGEFKEAEDYRHNPSLTQNPASPLPWSLRALLFETMGRLKESIEDYRKADELDPADPEYLYWICEIYLMFYDIPNTLKYCKMGQERFPGNYHFQMVKADAWLWKISIDNLEGAEKEEALANSRKILDRCLALNPDDGEILAIEGNMVSPEGRSRSLPRPLQKGSGIRTGTSRRFCGYRTGFGNSPPEKRQKRRSGGIYKKKPRLFRRMG